MPSVGTPTVVLLSTIRVSVVAPFAATLSILVQFKNGNKNGFLSQSKFLS
jgi:hypothetical protein